MLWDLHIWICAIICGEGIRNQNVSENLQSLQKTEKIYLKCFCEYMYFKTSSVASINIFRRCKVPFNAECCHFKALLYNKYGKNRLYISGGCRIICCNSSATTALLRNVIKYTPCTIIDTINTITKPIVVIITISKAMEASNWLTYTSDYRHSPHQPWEDSCLAHV